MGGDEKADDGEVLFKKKMKSKGEIEQEQTEFNRFIEKQKRFGKKKEKINMFEQLWGDDSKLDHTDKFLRKYILSKGWIDREDIEHNY